MPVEKASTTFGAAVQGDTRIRSESPDQADRSGMLKAIVRNRQGLPWALRLLAEVLRAIERDNAMRLMRRSSVSVRRRGAAGYANAIPVIRLDAAVFAMAVHLASSSRRSAQLVGRAAHGSACIARAGLAVSGIFAIRTVSVLKFRTRQRRAAAQTVRSKARLPHRNPASAGRDLRKQRRALRRCDGQRPDLPLSADPSPSLRRPAPSSRRLRRRRSRPGCALVGMCTSGVSDLALTAPPASCSPAPAAP